MFQKTVVLEPTGINSQALDRLKKLSVQVICYDDIPKDQAECVRRIDDADAVLVSYTTRIDRDIIHTCSGIRYIGMCCTLYSEESANVDMQAAREKGVVVKGIRDYGDDGVVEYVISELVRLLHGFGNHRWREQAYELTGLKAGIIGLGTTGRMIADALQFFGAEVSYYSRTPKPDAEAKGIKRKPLEKLLKESDIIGTCLPRNAIVLGEQEFRQLGQGKIFFNTSVGITFEMARLEEWLRIPGNFYLCDQVGMGEYTSTLTPYQNVIFRNRVSGHSAQCMERLSNKVIANVESFFRNEVNRLI